MQHTIEGLTPEKLQELSTRPDSLVMQPEYDYHSPWSYADLKYVLDLVFDTQIDDSTKKSDNLVKKFAKDHPMMYKNVFTDTIRNNADYRKMFYFMINKRRECLHGETSELTAASEVSDRALETVRNNTT